MSQENVDKEKLITYVNDAVSYATKGQLDNLALKRDDKNNADIAVFDFTSIKKAENSARIIERKGHKLLLGLVGDSLLEVSLFFIIVGDFDTLGQDKLVINPKANERTNRQTDKQANEQNDERTNINKQQRTSKTSNNLGQFFLRFLQRQCPHLNAFSKMFKTL